MGIQVEVKSSFPMAPAGQFQAVCVETVDLGYSTKNYPNQSGGTDVKNIHEIQYIFQLNKVDPETGKRYLIRSRPFNLMLSEKASLRAFLLQWRGHDITEDELKPPGVDVDLTGRNALLQVVHNKVGDKTYANIGAIMPLMDGMAEIQALDYEPQAEAILAAKAKAAAAGDPATTGQPAPVLGSQAAQTPAVAVDAVPSVDAAPAAASPT